MEKYIVSACLTGKNCKYNGKSNPCPAVIKLYKKGLAIPICPETLGGLPAPREPSEQRDGKIYSASGKDLTKEFYSGAEKAYRLALKSGVKKAILKSRSPSCGYKVIYNGLFDGGLTPGNGIWTEKMLTTGFEIYTEDNLPEELKIFQQ